MASPKCMEHNGASQKLEHPLNSPFLQCFRSLSEDPLLPSPPAVFPVGNVQWSAVVKPDGDTPELGWVGVKTDPSVWTPSTAFTSTSSTFTDDTGVAPGVSENLGYVTVGEVTEGGMVVVLGFPQNKLHHWPLTGEKTRKKSARERCAGSIICLRLSQVDALWSVWAQILHTCKHIGKEDAEGPIMRSYFLQRAEVIQVIQRDETQSEKTSRLSPAASLVSFPLRYDLSLLPCFHPPDISSLHTPTLLFLCVIIDSPYFGGGTLHHSWLDLIFLSRCLADKKIRAFVNKASILHLLPCIYCHFCDHTCGLKVMTHTDCYKADTQWEWGTTMWSTRKYHPHGRMCVTN